MARKVAQLASVIVLSAICQGPAVSQQQSTARPNLATGSTFSGSNDALPPDFRGEITYRGTYSGSVKTKPDRMRTLNLNEALRSVTSSRTLPLSGEYQLTVRYEGTKITGAFLTRSATGPNGASLDPQGSFSGTRNGTTCTVYVTGNVGAPPAITYCGLSRWEWASDKVYNVQGHEVAIRIMATQTSLVDFAERERKEALAAAEQQRIAAERARKEQAEAARLAALPRASAAQAKLLADAIGQDSQSWRFNRYDVGSLTNVRIDNASGVQEVRGDYTYNGGRQGWISGRLSNGRIACVAYHDNNSCNSIRKKTETLASDVSRRHVDVTILNLQDSDFSEEYLNEFHRETEAIRIRNAGKGWKLTREGPINISPACFSRQEEFVPGYTERTGTVIIGRDRAGEDTRDIYATTPGYTRTYDIYTCETRAYTTVSCADRTGYGIRLEKNRIASFNYETLSVINKLINDGICYRDTYSR